MKLAAFILSLIATISYGVLIIPLFWCIPMTVHIYKAYKGETDIGVGFKVCELLFVSLIAGILLLVDNEDQTQTN